MPVKISIKTTPPDLFARFNRYPRELDKQMRAANQRLKKVIVAAFPEYPPRISRYVRTYRLGKSLGMFGRKKADIERVEKIGQGQYHVVIGSNVEYAQWVIGDDTQAWMHQGIWWTIGDIGPEIENEIKNEGQKVMENMAAFVGGA